MRAIRVHQHGGPEVLVLEKDVPKPAIGDDEVLLKVISAGVNPVDTYIRSGKYPIQMPLPYTPGSDGAGIVESVGKSVVNVKPGDRVFCSRAKSGSYAEYASVPANRVWRLDERLTFEQGASIGVPYYTAYRALIHKCNVKPGEMALIHGASGAVGIACLQLCSVLGVKVIGTAGTDEGLALIKQHGAVMGFNHRKEGYMKDIMAYTGGKGLNVLVEMLANVNLNNDLTMMSHGGRIAVVGSRGPLTLDPRGFMMNECSVTGVVLSYANDAEWASMGAAISAGTRPGGWVTPVVHKAYELGKTCDAHEDVIAHETGARGKIVLDCTK